MGKASAPVRISRTREAPGTGPTSPAEAPLTEGLVAERQGDRRALAREALVLGPGVIHLELETHALPVEVLGARRRRRVPRVHEGKAGRSRVAGAQEDEPGRLEDDLSPNQRR